MQKGYLNRLIVFSYLTLLLFHFYVNRHYKIYPSLVFPAFSQAPHIEDDIQYANVELYAITNQNNLKVIKKEDFFNGYKKHVNYFLATIISNETTKSVMLKHSNANASGSFSKSLLSESRSAFLKYSAEQLNKIYPNESFMGILIARNIKSYSTKKLTFNKDLKGGSVTVIYFKN